MRLINRRGFIKGLGYIAAVTSVPLAGVLSRPDLESDTEHDYFFVQDASNIKPFQCIMNMRNNTFCRVDEVERDAVFYTGIMSQPFSFRAGDTIMIMSPAFDDGAVPLSKLTTVVSPHGRRLRYVA